MRGRFAIYSQPPEVSRRLGLPETDAGWRGTITVAAPGRFGIVTGHGG